MSTVKSSGFQCPAQIRRILETLRRYSQIDLYGRPQFPVGLVIGEGTEQVHITPEKAKDLLALLEQRSSKKPAQKTLDMESTT